MTGRRYFAPRNLDEAHLVDLGVTVEDSTEPETAEYDREHDCVFVDVGNVYVSRSGRVTVLVRDGARLRPWAVEALLTRAEAALLGDMHRFRRHGASDGPSWWWTTVSLRMLSDDPHDHALAAALELGTRDRVRLDIVSRATDED